MSKQARKKEKSSEAGISGVGEFSRLHFLCFFFSQVVYKFLVLK